MISTILHSALIFFFLMATLRLMGKRELSQISAFDLVILFIIGDIVAESVVQEDTSSLGAITSVAVFALLTILMSWISYRWSRTRSVIDGISCIIIVDGEPDRSVMRRERITLDDLQEAARSHDIRDLADVELGVLEPNGKFSFFTRTR